MPHLARTTLLLLVSLASISNVSAIAIPQLYPGSRANSQSSNSNRGSIHDENSMNIESDESIAANDLDAGFPALVQNADNGGLVPNGNNAGNLIPEAVNWDGLSSPSVSQERTGGADPAYVEDQTTVQLNSGRASEQGMEEEVDDNLFQNEDGTGNQGNGEGRGGGGGMEEEQPAEGDEDWADAGYSPDQRALDQDLEGTGGRQAFDTAPESLTNPNTNGETTKFQIETETQQPEDFFADAKKQQTDLDASQASVETGDMTPTGSPRPSGSPTLIIEEEEQQQQEGQQQEGQLEEEIPPENPWRFDISGLPPLDPDFVVTVDNEYDEEGNMQMLTERPDYDVLYPPRLEQQGPDPAEQERNRRLAEEAQLYGWQQDEEFIEAAEKRAQEMEEDLANGINIFKLSDPDYLASLPKNLPDELLPPGANDLPDYRYRNSEGQVVDEWGNLLDDNGQRIMPKPVTRRVPIPMKKRPVKYTDDPELTQYLQKWGNVNAPISVDDRDYTSRRSSIIPVTSPIQFRQPPRRGKDNVRSQRQRNMAQQEGQGSGQASSSARRTPTETRWSFLGQPYVNYMSAQEIQDSMVAQEALEQEQRRANSQAQQQSQGSTGQNNAFPPQFSSEDPGEMTVEEIQQLFALQQQQEEEQARARSQMTRSEVTSAAMTMEAEAGGPEPRTNSQGTQTNQRQSGTQTNTNFDPDLYTIAGQAFHGNEQLSAMNNLAGMSTIPRIGGNLFNFDLNDLSGGQGNNLNPGLNNNDVSNQGNSIFPTYQTEQTSEQASAPTIGRTRRNAAAQGEARRRGRMSDEEVVNYLLGLGIPVGDENGLYSIEDLRELVNLMMSNNP
ncbi:hypothetical protein TWF281_002424 [Arthrobotrys megalospora]